jgi:tripeptidyl-peptidase-1
MGVAVGSPTTFWSIKQNGTFQADNILKWAYAVGNVSNPPLVHSLSYGMPEDKVDKAFGAGYLARSDVEFQKLAVRGLTIIIACGDTGAGDLGSAPEEKNCDTLHADWPSQSPYVSALGTTFITPFSESICYFNKGTNCAGNPLGEASVSVDAGFLWTTGGGFSNISTMPGYQAQFVQNYLQNHPSSVPSSSIFNNKGRAYPDFATVGHNVMVAQQGQFIGVDGTSCSAPIFGGIVTLLNDIRLNANKSALGFLNPLFYQIASEYPYAFRDVTVGENKCGEIGFNPVCCKEAFQATEGWDAVSGLGSPNFAILSQVINQF